MAYNLTTLEQTVSQALDVLLPSATIIFADQDGPRPTNATYVTCKISGDRGTGLRSFLLTDTAGASAGDFVQQVGRHRESTLVMQSFGPDAYETLRDMELALENPDTSYQLSNFGLMIEDSSGVQRVQLALASETEDRATCTYTVRYYSVTQSDVAAMASAEGTPTYNGETYPPVIVTGLDD